VSIALRQILVSNYGMDRGGLIGDVCWDGALVSGGLIQTRSGTAGGLGCPATNRSGWAVAAASRICCRAAVAAVA